MRIEDAAAAVNVQILRFYERVGLLPRPPRRASGYRAYDRLAVRRVRFIRRAQELGFTLAEMRDLLGLREESETACAQVEARASATLDRIAEKIQDLERMRAALSEYVDSCRRHPGGGVSLLRALDLAGDGLGPEPAPGRGRSPLSPRGEDAVSEPGCCECSWGRTIARLSTSSFDVAECEYAAGQRFADPARDRAALCLVVDGGYVEERGRGAFRHGPASLVFHPAGASCSTVISPNGSRCLTIEIAADVISTLGARHPLGERLASSRTTVAHWFAYKVRNELRDGDPLAPLVIEGVGLALLAEFVRAPSARLDRAAPAWLERVREQLHEEFASPPSPTTLANGAGVHRVHVARAFRKHYACTVGEYVRQRRIEYASHRLVAADAPLIDVALDSGYADQSHFTTAFKRLVGVPPGEFRSRVRSHQSHQRKATSEQ